MSYKVFVVSAPSGTGKTTLNQMFVEKHKNFEVAISLTTRPMRPGEISGKDYLFIDRENFERQTQQNQLLEWAEVFGNYYGTQLSEIKRISGAGKTPILEIDVQGWVKAKPKLSNPESIFILPPSMAVLWDRLKSRSTDQQNTIYRRIKDSRKELEYCSQYHHFVINDSVEHALVELEKIMVQKTSPSLTYDQGVAHCHKLIQEFEHARWLTDVKKQVD